MVWILIVNCVLFLRFSYYKSWFYIKFTGRVTATGVKIKMLMVHLGDKEKSLKVPGYDFHLVIHHWIQKVLAMCFFWMWIGTKMHGASSWNKELSKYVQRLTPYLHKALFSPYNSNQIPNYLYQGLKCLV